MPNYLLRDFQYSNTDYTLLVDYHFKSDFYRTSPQDWLRWQRSAAFNLRPHKCLRPESWLRSVRVAGAGLSSAR